MLRALKHTWLLLLMLLVLSEQICGQSSVNSDGGLEGSWQGTLELNAAKLPLVLILTKTGAGKYEGRLDGPTQGETVSLDVVVVNGSFVRLEVKRLRGLIECTLNEARSEMIGRYTQAGSGPFVISFKRIDAAKVESAVPKKPFDVPVDAYVPAPPTAFRAEGKTHLVYELHVTNFGREDCVLTQVEVLDGDNKDLLARYEGDKLAGSLARPGVSVVNGAERLRIGGGLRAVVYIWVTLETRAVIPRALRHRLSAKVGAYPASLSVECAPITVGSGPPVIAAPLRGGEWLAGNGPSNTSTHRRALIPVNGAARIAQRFAIDWMQLYEDGRTFTGDPLDNRNYRCYGAEALAVADAIVVTVKDGIPENTPGVNLRAVSITRDTAGGNHVVLDLGQGRYAFYGHLQPGRIRVKAGDKVRRGQVLGLVGNSGNSTEPHLHFQVSDGDSLLGANGLPYALEFFEVQGKGRNWKTSETKTEIRAKEMPLENEVVRFPLQSNTWLLLEIRSLELTPATSSFRAAHVERPGVGERSSPMNIGGRTRHYFTD